MKYMCKIFCLLLLIIFFCSLKSVEVENICDLIKEIKSSAKQNYNFALKDGFVISDAIFLDEKNFKLFFDYDKSKVDTTYLIGKFKISNQRQGVVSYTKTYECDHQISYYSLSVIENCKVITTKQIQYKDNESFIYELTSSLNKDFSILTIYRNKSSEYANEPDFKSDTLFSDIYKIDLKSKAVDTIFKKMTFKKLKSSQNNLLLRANTMNLSNMFNDKLIFLE